MAQAGGIHDGATVALRLVDHIVGDVDNVAGHSDVETSSYLLTLSDRLRRLVPNENGWVRGHKDAVSWIPSAASKAPDDHRPMADAFADLAPHLLWETPYESADRTPELLHFWANYTAAVVTAPADSGWASGPLVPSPGAELALFVTVQGAETVYPAHRHPAVEVYGVVSGTGHWLRGAEGFRPRRPGEVFLHRSNMVHATTTMEEATISWVAWLSDLESSPALVSD